MKENVFRLLRMNENERFMPMLHNGYNITKVYTNDTCH